MLDSNKIKTLLEKINWLTNSFEDNNYNNISSLEKSLLKEKVLMFFDEIENIPTTIIKDRAVNQVVNEDVKPIIEEVIIVKQEVEVSTPVAVVEEVVIVEPVAIVEPVVVVAEVKNPEPLVVVEEVNVPEPKIIEIQEVVVVKEEILQEPVVVVQEVIISEPQIIVEPTKEERFQKMEALHREVSAIRRDMREIIDLNKSFIFKAELFNQSNDLYNQFINEMNSTRTEDNAFILLNNWTMKMNWRREDNKAYELLERAIEKRFLPLLS